VLSGARTYKHMTCSSGLTKHVRMKDIIFPQSVRWVATSRPADLSLHKKSSPHYTPYGQHKMKNKCLRALFFMRRETEKIRKETKAQHAIEIKKVMLKQEIEDVREEGNYYDHRLRNYLYRDDIDVITLEEEQGFLKSENFRDYQHMCYLHNIKLRALKKKKLAEYEIVLKKKISRMYRGVICIVACRWLKLDAHYRKKYQKHLDKKKQAHLWIELYGS